jgi:hypothetical protein
VLSSRRRDPSEGWLAWKSDFPSSAKRVTREGRVSRPRLARFPISDSVPSCNLEPLNS